MDPRYIDAIDYDAAGRQLRAYCLAAQADKLRLLTADQERALEAGLEVVVVTSLGQRTDLRLVGHARGEGTR